MWNEERVTAVAVSIAFCLVAAILGGMYANGVFAQSGTVALINPGFEGEYVPFEDIGELKVPDGWRPWWSGRRPEYLPYLAIARHGLYSQKIFTTYSAQDAGIYQIVTGVIPGQWYTFKVWVYPQSEADAGGGSAMACINPWGNWDATHRTTVCGKERSFGAESWQEPYGQWYQVEVTAQAWSETITVFTRYVAKFPVRWNDAFWDDASLELVTIGGTCPTPAPPCATVAPCPTSAPVLTPGPNDCATVPEIEALLRGMTWGVTQ